MRTAYIANVGTRDIRVDAQTLKFNEVRAESQRILDTYAEHRARLTAPILFPGIKQVLETLGNDKRIDLVLLFITDQDPHIEQSRNDTLYIGRILERFLPEQFGSRIGAVECCVISSEPANYDKMGEVFGTALRNRIKPDDFNHVWVAPVGGIPACNTAMLLNAVRLYRHKSELIFVEENKPAQTLTLHQEILRDYAREEAHAHLARRDFTALRDTMERAALGDPWHRHLCTYAERRLHFDFDGAHKALEDAINDAPDAAARATLGSCQQSLAPLMKSNRPADSSSLPAEWNEWIALQSANIGELYFNLRHKSDRKEWVDFLGRLFRLHEAALRIMFERKKRHSAEQVGWDYPDFVNALNTDGKLLAYFKGAKVSIKKADTKGLRTWLEYECNHDPATYKDQLDRCKAIEGLKTIRNKSIMAHDYQGVSQTDLESHLTPLSIHAFVDGPMRDYLAHPQIGAAVAPLEDPLLPVVDCLEKALVS